MRTNQGNIASDGERHRPPEMAPDLNEWSKEPLKASGFAFAKYS